MIETDQIVQKIPVKKVLVGKNDVKKLQKVGVHLKVWNIASILREIGLGKGVHLRGAMYRKSSRRGVPHRRDEWPEKAEDREKRHDSSEINNTRTHARVQVN